MDPNSFNTDNTEQLTTNLKKAIDSDRSATYKSKMRQGIDYYKHKHEIEKLQLIYVDNEGKAHVETARSNIKIPHSYFTELVDQKVQYLLSNTVEVTTEDTAFQVYLDEYLDEDFQLMLQELVEGASQKGYEYAYVKLDNDRLQFRTADSLKVIEVYDENANLVYIIRYYDSEIYIDGKRHTVTKVELWDSEKVWYFATDASTNKQLKLDKSVEINPMYLDMQKNDKTGDVKVRSLGEALEIDNFIPFLRLDNNKYKTTDLEPVKALIDDYDLMACSLSNNLQDFDQPFFAVKGFNGDNYEQLINNLRSRGAVGVGDTGGLEVHTVNIPVEARREKLKVDKEGIYKFGMGFDSSQVGDGNVTNVVIQSRYTLLDLKCNKAEIRLRQLLKRMLKLIVADINRRFNKAYDADDLTITMTRDTMIDETEVTEREKVQADTKQVLLETVLEAAPRLDDETVLKYICDTLELDFDEVQELLGAQDYIDEDVTEDGTAE